MTDLLPWTEESDSLLRTEVANNLVNGKVNWIGVAKAFPARTPGSCESRWYRLGEGTLVDSPVVEDTDKAFYQKLFEQLRDNPMSLEEIANHFDRSPKFIKEKLEKMETEGYNLIIGKSSFAVQTSTLPQATSQPQGIADFDGNSITIAIASDWHAGSKHSQPTRLNEFIHYAVKEYGVKHVFVSGDATDGAFVYGQAHIDNLIPNVRPLNRNRVWATAEAEVFLADAYAPRIDGVQYYVMGGNHDKSIITNSGKDPIRMFSEKRPDVHYGGYDVWSIRLTDKSYIRLIHPTGGIAYARSYKLQKAIEGMAFEALREAMADELPPMTSLLIMGHYHLTCHQPEPPLHGVLAGCFQGQTDYLKTKNLTPHIGGIIMELKFEKYGKLSQVFHMPVLMGEIKDDWKNWPLPQIEDPAMVGDDLDVLFSFSGPEADRATDEAMSEGYPVSPVEPDPLSY